MQGVVQRLQAVMASRKAMCCIHTLGFGADHDANFLTALTRAGTDEGTFHYIQGSSQIPTTMQTIQDLMIASSFAPRLQLETADGALVAMISLARKPLGEEEGESKGISYQALAGTGYMSTLPAALTSFQVVQQSLLVAKVC